MNADQLRAVIDPEAVPRSLPGRPRVTAQIKAVPEDFVVEEVPAYEPEGDGPHLYLWIEKRDCAGGEMLRRLAGALGISPQDIGAAGTKDKRAVTRQWVSVPADRKYLVDAGLGLDRIQVVKTALHGNKLRTGHLTGNRFTIVLRGADATLLPALVQTGAMLERDGFLNLYGPQRFGRDGETARIGLAMLEAQGRPDPSIPRLGGFERRMAISAVQSALFNRYAAMRAERGLLRQVLAGDVMAKTLSGGVFWADDVAVEQARLDAGETRVSGPMFGHKMMAARADAGVLEQAILDEVGITPTMFKVFTKLAEGTRRPLLVKPSLFDAAAHPDGIELSFFLPKGCYASVLLREFVESPDLAHADGD